MFAVGRRGEDSSFTRAIIAPLVPPAMKREDLERLLVSIALTAAGGCMDAIVLRTGTR
jgi:hypothetical protein